jgi:hypothetical protein
VGIGGSLEIVWRRLQAKVKDREQAFIGLQGFDMINLDFGKSAHAAVFSA